MAAPDIRPCEVVRWGAVPRGAGAAAPLPRPRLLRISVTDRCNFRCRYCMPAEGEGLASGATLLPAQDLAELAVWLAATLGIDRVKLTGGEPLVRAGIEQLVERLAATPGIREVSLTTNGSLLGRLAGALKLAGLARVNVSLDSLDAGRFANLTRGARVGDTQAGIDAALSAGLSPVKLNAVLHRSTWRDDVPQLIGYAASRGLEIRFIELMRTGTLTAEFGANGNPLADARGSDRSPDREGGVAQHGRRPGIERSWPDAEFVPAEEVRRWIETRAPVTPKVAPAGNPARMTTVDWHGIRVAVGWIMPRSHPFCHACERVRLDARGRLRRCLMDPSLFDLAGERRANGDAAARAALAAYMDGKRAPGTMDGLRSMSSVGG